MPGKAVEHLAGTVSLWEACADRERALAARNWAAIEPSWGIFSVPESVVHLLPEDLAGMNVIELGCGTGYVSAWMARLGARPVAIDPTPSQLAIAAASQAEHALSFPLVRAAAEQVPLRDGSFDFAFSEYGAAIWADPLRWIEEAARLLRPGGELVFLGNSTLLMLCTSPDDDRPATTALEIPQAGMYRFQWPGDSSVEFHLSHGDWIRLCRRHGFELEDLVEIYAGPGASTVPGYDLVSQEWAAKWPCEEAWRFRKKPP